MSNRKKIKNVSALALSSALAATALSPATASAPSELEVTNCNDSGAGSLRQAIADAASQATITFDLSCNTITLEEEILFGDKYISIVGPGVDKLTITNNTDDTNDYGPQMFTALGNSSVSVSSLTFAAESGTGLGSKSIIYSEGSIDLTSVEVTGGSFSVFDPFRAAGMITASSSTFTGIYIHDQELLRGNSALVDNSSFVGNTLYEGTLVYSYGKTAVTRSAFVNNIPDASDGDAMSGLRLIRTNSESLQTLGNYFIEPEAISERVLYSVEEGVRLDDFGANFYVVDPSLTSIHGVTNTSVGNGASVLLPGSDLGLGEFAGIEDAQYGMSPRVYAVESDSVLIDAYSFETYLDRSADIMSEIQVAGLPNFDAVGDRRAPFEALTAGPVEYLSASTAVSVMKKRNVFFAPMSPKLSKYAKTSLRKLANSVPDGASNVRIKLVGFVQPAGFSWNNESLSKARTRSVQRFLKNLGIRGTWKLVAKGEDSKTTKEARRVEATIRFNRPIS